VKWYKINVLDKVNLIHARTISILIYQSRLNVPLRQDMTQLWNSQRLTPLKNIQASMIHMACPSMKTTVLGQKIYDGRNKT
jgi:hypothetical protein